MTTTKTSFSLATDANGLIAAAVDCGYSLASTTAGIVASLKAAKLPKDPEARAATIKLLRDSFVIGWAARGFEKSGKRGVTMAQAMAEAIRLSKLKGFTEKTAGKEGFRTKDEDKPFKAGRQQWSVVAAAAGLEAADNRGGARPNAGAKGKNSEEANTEPHGGDFLITKPTAAPAPAPAPVQAPRNVIELPVSVSTQLDAAKQMLETLEKFETFAAANPDAFNDELAPAMKKLHAAYNDVKKVLAKYTAA